jgi:hypothetical protein
MVRGVRWKRAVSLPRQRLVQRLVNKPGKNKEHTMLKKIALSAIFAVASIVSFNSSSVNAAKPVVKSVPSVGAPVMKGIRCGGSSKC